MEGFEAGVFDSVFHGRVHVFRHDHDEDLLWEVCDVNHNGFKVSISFVLTCISSNRYGELYSSDLQ